MSTESRLDRLYRESEVLCFDRRARIVLMSDCHRGVGNHGDNFLKNQHLFFAALTYYNQREFTYIELGDGDELWENRRLDRIISVHSNIFWLLSVFYQKNRFRMLYGNHDRSKEKKRFMERFCKSYYCDSTACHRDLFPNMTAKEGLILEERGTGNRIFLAHGHQGDLLNDTLWRLARFLVRHLWRRLELWGVLDPTSAARNYKLKAKTERRLARWADKGDALLVAGHTHRPVLPKPGSSRYLNTGSCVHPRCITAIEIENGFVTLVKWSTLTKPDRSLYVGREVLEGPFRLEEYFAG